MTEVDDARRVFRAELSTAVHGEGAALWTGIAFAIAITGLLAGRTLAHGTLAGTGAYDVTVQAVREALPVIVPIVAGLRYAQRCRLGVDRELYLAGVSRWARLTVVLSDATVVVGAIWIGELAAITVGAGGLSHQPARDLGSLLVGTALGGLVLAALSAAIARLANSTAAFVVMALGAPLVGSLLSWAGFAYPALDALAQLWPWRAATSFVSAVSGGRYVVGVLTSAITLVVAAVVLSRDPQQPARPSAGRPPEPAAALDGSRSHRAAIAATSAAAVVAIAWGATVPATLSRFVPWYLRPQWLAQEAGHTSSQDVAIAWLRAVQAGDRAAARRLAGAPVERIAGPLKPWLSQEDPTTATMDRSYGGNPGEVAFESTHAGDGDELTAMVFVCLVHSSATWRVSAVRSAPDCPQPHA